MNKNQILKVNLKNQSGEAIALSGIFLTVSFFVNGVYRFGFRTGSSDSQGCVEISFEDMEKDRWENLEVQPLDFKTTLDECDTLVIVSLPSKDELIRAADTLDTMGEGRFPEISTLWRKASNGLLSAEECEVELDQALNICDLVCVCH